MKKSVDFNKELLHLYLDSEMSQYDFSIACKQSSSSINHWLNNHQNMSFEKFIDVCNNLGIKVDINIGDNFSWTKKIM
jgi:hypothetical protein